MKPHPATHDTALKLFHPLKPLRARIVKAPPPPPHSSILCQFASSSCLSLFASLLPLPSNPLQSLYSLSRSDRLIVFLPLSCGALGEEGSAAGACPVHTIKHAVHTDLSEPSHVHHLLQDYRCMTTHVNYCKAPLLALNHFEYFIFPYTLSYVLLVHVTCYISKIHCYNTCCHSFKVNAALFINIGILIFICQ